MTEPTGYTALDLIGFTDQGDYDSSTAYVQNDLVHYNNSVWRCLIDDTTGQTPAEGSYWTIFVESTTAADGISYDNTDSGLTAETVQAAIDEVVDEKADSTIISDAYSSTTTYAAGDYFIYDNTLYYVDVACTGITPPNTSYYTATSVTSEIYNLALTDISSDITNTDLTIYYAYKIGSIVVFSVAILDLSLTTGYSSTLTCFATYRPYQITALSAYQGKATAPIVSAALDSTGSIVIRTDTTVSNFSYIISGTFVLK